MSNQTKRIIRDLGNGLVLHHGSPEDGEAFALFNGEYLDDEGLDGGMTMERVASMRCYRRNIPMCMGLYKS